MLIKWNYSYEARKIPVFNILLDLTTAQHVYKHSYFSYLWSYLLTNKNVALI